jgi:hypothetical protein
VVIVLAKVSHGFTSGVRQGQGEGRLTLHT